MNFNPFHLQPQISSWCPRYFCWNVHQTIKSSCFCRVNAFVNPSAGMREVGTHSKFILFAWASCLNQKWWTSTCLNFVFSSGSSLVSKSTVWALSHNIEGVGEPISRPIAVKRRRHQYVSFAAWDIARSSASVIEVVTVFYFVALQLPPLLQRAWRGNPLYFCDRRDQRMPHH